MIASRCQGESEGLRREGGTEGEREGSEVRKAGKEEESIREKEVKGRKERKKKG